MVVADLDKLNALSPFELKDRLVALAASHTERLALNAGRGNPNFLAAAPRHGFFQLGRFGMAEAERNHADLPPGTAGFPSVKGIARRFSAFVEAHRGEPGIDFLDAATQFARDTIGFDEDALLHELTLGILGCTYPEPVRMLPHAEAILRRYLQREIAGRYTLDADIDLFAVEGASAGVTYLFNSLRLNRLIAPGDVIAIGMPTFTPYIEIPQLGDYKLTELPIEADPNAGWQYPESELDKLLDPRIKIFLLVNPGNPSSVKISDAGLAKISQIVALRRPDLILLTDDVYATLADDFCSVFAVCPHNTILVYSFSKYFGTTGWRLGVVAMSRGNVLDEKIAALPEAERQSVDARYGSLVVDPRNLRFIDRVVADSRSIGLNHTAGLSTPQQVQMALFGLFGLLDEHAYKQAMKRLIRGRYHAFYQALGIEAANETNEVDYYAILDLKSLGARLYGPGFADWFIANHDPLELLFRLADEEGIVLLPGKGFGIPHPSARVSLANLNEAEYRQIGRAIRSMLDKYAEKLRAASPASRA